MSPRPGGGGFVFLIIDVGIIIGGYLFEGLKCSRQIDIDLPPHTDRVRDVQIFRRL